nr:MAG TPA: hypothetical protein [Caudoviricetes sp.]
MRCAISFVAGSIKISTLIFCPLDCRLTSKSAFVNMREIKKSYQQEKSALVYNSILNLL